MIGFAVGFAVGLLVGFVIGFLVGFVIDLFGHFFPLFLHSQLELYFPDAHIQVLDSDTESYSHGRVHSDLK